MISGSRLKSGELYRLKKDKIVGYSNILYHPLVHYTELKYKSFNKEQIVLYIRHVGYKTEIDLKCFVFYCNNMYFYIGTSRHIKESIKRL